MIKQLPAELNDPILEDCPPVAALNKSKPRAPLQLIPSLRMTPPVLPALGGISGRRCASTVLAVLACGALLVASSFGQTTAKGSVRYQISDSSLLEPTTRDWSFDEITVDGLTVTNDADETAVTITGHSSQSGSDLLLLVQDSSLNARFSVTESGGIGLGGNVPTGLTAVTGAGGSAAGTFSISFGAGVVRGRDPHSSFGSQRDGRPGRRDGSCQRIICHQW